MNKKQIFFDFAPGYRDNMRLLRCPQCGSDQGKHFLSITVMQQPEKTIVTSKGTVVTLADDALEYAEKQSASRRGSTVSLEYWCEDCHGHGTLDYQFHEGVIQVTHKTLNELSPEEFDELWRD